jgi:predicted amidohydrolase YtcJ
MNDDVHADLILHGGQLTTLDPANPSATALAVNGERILTVGSVEQALMHFRGPRTTVLDIGGRRAVPGESIGRFLDIFEAINRDVPFDGLHWFIDHAETVTDRNLGRIKALGGAIAIQHRMAYQGEYFVDRYEAKAAERTPPIARIIEMGIPVAAGTDATRVASYNPWVCLQWLVTGRTVGGLSVYPEANRLDREAALRLWTPAAGWFSNEDGARGLLKAGQSADLAVLTEDYFAVPEDRIPAIESALTLVGGNVVYAAAPFLGHSPPPIRPDWSPVSVYGYHRAAAARPGGGRPAASGSTPPRAASRHRFDGCRADGRLSWGRGCGCWAF